MPSAVQKYDIALDGLKRFYRGLFREQLAAFHRVSPERIDEWKTLDFDSMKWRIHQVGHKQDQQGKAISPEEDHPFTPEEAVQNVFVLGALGTGKTELQYFKEIYSCVFIPDNYGVHVRKRHEELINHSWKFMREFLEKRIGEHWESLFAMQKTGGHIQPKQVGGAYVLTFRTPWDGETSQLLLKHEPDASPQQIEDHWKGPEFGFVLGDETTELSKKTCDTLQGRLRRPFFKLFPRKHNEGEIQYIHRVNKMSSYLWWSCWVSQPPYAGEWLDEESRRIEDEAKMGNKEDSIVIRIDMDKNPYLADDYKRRTKRKWVNDPVEYGRLVLGKNGVKIDGVPVFKDAFRSDLHLQDLSYHPGWPLIVGLDFGWHRPAALFLQETPDYCYNALMELCPTKKEATDFFDMVLTAIRRNFPYHARLDGPEVYFYGDHAGTQKTDKGPSTIDRIHDAFPGVTIVSQPLDLEPSIDVVRDALKHMTGSPLRPRLLINSAGCPVLIQSMAGGYYYPMRAGQRDPKPHKTPLNHMDDVQDAGRYALNGAMGPFGGNGVASKFTTLDEFELQRELRMKGSADEALPNQYRRELPVDHKDDPLRTKEQRWR